MGVGGPFGVGRLGGWDWKDLEWIVKSGIQMERLFDARDGFFLFICVGATRADMSDWVCCLVLG